jgi:hypothetical protein
VHGTDAFITGEPAGLQMPTVASGDALPAVAGTSGLSTPDAAAVSGGTVPPSEGDKQKKKRGFWGRIFRGGGR